MRWRCRTDVTGTGSTAGTVTAEFAVAVPAVLIVLAACLGGVRIGAEQLRVVDAASAAARIAARGDPRETTGVAAGTVLERSWRSGDTVCVALRRDVRVLGLPVPVRATGCALSGLRP